LYFRKKKAAGSDDLLFDSYLKVWLATQYYSCLLKNGSRELELSLTLKNKGEERF
jgi:hypothetical protein